MDRVAIPAAATTIMLVVLLTPLFDAIVAVKQAILQTSAPRLVYFVMGVEHLVMLLGIVHERLQLGVKPLLQDQLEVLHHLKRMSQHVFVLGLSKLLLMKHGRLRTWFLVFFS
jgi:hypothetical protein